MLKKKTTMQFPSLYLRVHHSVFYFLPSITLVYLIASMQPLCLAVLARIHPKDITLLHRRWMQFYLLYVFNNRLCIC